MDVKLKIFKKDDNKEFRLVQNFILGEPDFNQFMQLRNQLVTAAENLSRKLVSSADNYSVQRHDRTIETGSQGGSRSASITRKDLCNSVWKNETALIFNFFATKKEDEMFQQIA